MIHDQYTDRSFRVLAQKRHGAAENVRDLIKTAEINYDEQDTLPATSFAWPEMRKFAVHTPQHTALSLLYASGENVPQHVRQTLDKYAELYGIEHEVAQQEKVAAAEDPNDYMVPQLRLGKITHKGHVKEASQFFTNNYRKMDLETRTHAAKTLVKKASDFNCRISPTFYKHAGLTQTNPRILGEWLEVRANLSSNATAKNGFSKLAAYVQDPESFSVCSRQDLIKIADTIAILDEKADLVRRYDLTIPDPLLTVFNTSKIASATVDLAGRKIPLSSLLAIDPQTYGDVLGADIVPEITKDGEMEEGALLDVLRSLPADLQSLLVTRIGL